MPATKSRPALKPLAVLVQAIVLGTALGALSHAPVALAQSAETKKTYNIPPGNLEDALNTFARQAGITLSFDPALVQGQRSAGLQGSYNINEGLRLLLAGSGLKNVRAESGSYSLRRDGDAAVLPTVNVKAGAIAETATGPVKGYFARRSASATKTDTPIIETPQSVSVVTADQVETLKAKTIEQAFAYTAGIVPRAGYSASLDSAKSRGFMIRADSGSYYRDGLKVSNSSWASGKQEPYGLERLELIKGPASVLYGAVAPGGVINTVSKRPTPDLLREVSVEIGSLDHKQAAADLGGALNADGSVSWRLTAVRRDADTTFDHIENDGTYFAPALKWQISPDTSLTLLSFFQELDTVYNFGVPAVGTLLRSPAGKIPRDRFIGEPDFDRLEAKQRSVGYEFEHAFSPETRLRHAFRHFNSDVNVHFTGFDAPLNDRVYTRYAYDEYEDVSGFSTDTSIEHRLITGAVSHTLLAGIDYSRFKPTSAFYLWQNVPSLDLYDPDYGATYTSRAHEGTEKKDSERTGMYLQDQMKIADKWIVLLGGRYDWSDDTTTLVLGGTTRTQEREEAFTGRIGTLYLFDSGWAPYASYSESFEPQAGVDHNRQRFKPTTGEQYEIGIRYQPHDSAWQFSAAIYEITKQNIVKREPLNPTIRRQVGETRSRGLELELKGQLTKHFNVIAAYAYTDVRITESLEQDEVGQREPEVPYHQLSAWGDYDLGAFGWRGWKVGLGARYIGRTPTRIDGVDMHVPSYTLVDAMLSYTQGPWRFALNASNLTDKEYLACSEANCNYGDARQVIGSVSYKF